jgi:hypothetical protein
MFGITKTGDDDNLRRIADALEGIRELYELDLIERGIYKPRDGMADEVEICYGPKEPSEPEWMS